MRDGVGMVAAPDLGLGELGVVGLAGGPSATARAAASGRVTRTHGTCGTGRSQRVAPQPRSTTLPLVGQLEHLLGGVDRDAALVGAQPLDQRRPCRRAGG